MAHDPLRLFFHGYDNDCANFYYRSLVLSRTLQEHYGVSLTTGRLWEPRTEEDMNSFMLGCSVQDIVQVFSLGGRNFELFLRTLRKLPSYTEGGKRFTPPLTVMDLDDNVDFVHPFNPQFKKLGTRTPDGVPLSVLYRHRDKGIYIKVEDTGEKIKIWEDGMDGFDVRMNERFVRSLNKSLQLASACTFPTERLRKYYADTYGLVYSTVFPNSVIFEDYPDVRLAKRGGIRVMWQGGSSHYQDMFPLRRTLGEAARRFPEITWVMWTDKMYKWVTEEIPEDRIEWHPWVPYAAYKIKLAAMDFDIALAPLIENVFNHGKSAIKWYEVSALAEPKPLLASDVPPYCDEIEDGKTGFLFDMPANREVVSMSFMEKLEILVRNEEKRRELAENAKTWVREHREAKVTVGAWLEWMKSLKEIQEHGGLQRSKGASFVRKALPPPVRAPR